MPELRPIFGLPRVVAMYLHLRRKWLLLRNCRLDIFKNKRSLGGNGITSSALLIKLQSKAASALSCASDPDRFAFRDVWRHISEPASSDISKAKSSVKSPPKSTQCIGKLDCNENSKGGKTMKKRLQKVLLAGLFVLSIGTLSAMFAGSASAGCPPCDQYQG